VDCAVVVLVWLVFWLGKGHDIQLFGYGVLVYYGVDAEHVFDVVAG
jgi:predicted HAD superfamily Cof-like phosphohydrolase